MKSRNFILGLAIALGVASIITIVRANPVEGTTASRKQEIEKEILRREEAGRQKVLRADNNWDDLIADGAYMIGFDGSVTIFRKGTQFPSLPVKTFTLTEMIARVYGDVVVVTGLADVEAETPAKKPYSFQMRFINVWKRSGGSWKIVVSERTGVRPLAKQ